MVKTYMSLYDSQIITDYLKTKAASFVADAKASDFATAASKDGVTVTDVTTTPMNVGASGYLSSFSTTDPNGMLTYADTDTVKKMYTSETGTVLDPFEAGSSTVVVKVGDESSSGNSYLTALYKYYAAMYAQQDLIESFMHSDQFKDNFLTVFLTDILGRAPHLPRDFSLGKVQAVSNDRLSFPCMHRRIPPCSMK
jgi:hypothetical protein